MVRLRTLAAGIGIAGLLATACGDDTADETAGTTADGADATTTNGGSSAGTTSEGADDDGDGSADRCTEERQGGDLTMSVFSETRGLDPVQSVGGGVAGGTELTAIYDRLARWNPDTGEYEPWLAESFESNDDASVWTVTLRPDVTFSNGDPLDAEAVKASIERFADPDLTSHYASLVEQVEEIVVVDDLELRFELVEPWATFPYLLAGQTGLIVNPAVAEDLGPDELNLAPVGAGAGAFEFARWSQGEEIVLEGRDDYWGGPVCIDELRFVANPSAQATYDSFQTGEYDVAFLREPVVIEQAKADGATGYENLQNAGDILLLNHRNEPVSDVRVRRAIAQAVDVELINERAHEGTSLPTQALMHESSLTDPGVPGITHDPDNASQLVEEVKADGWDGSIRLLCDQRPSRQETAITVQSMLESVGFEVELTSVPTTELIQAVTVESNFDIACYGFNIAEGVLWPNFDRKVRSGSSGQSMGMENDEMDAAIEQLKTAGTIEEQSEVMGDIQEIWNEVVPTVVLSGVREQIVWQDDVHGVVPTLETIMMLDGVWRE